MLIMRVIRQMRMGAGMPGLLRLVKRVIRQITAGWPAKLCLGLW